MRKQFSILFYFCIEQALVDNVSSVYGSALVRKVQQRHLMAKTHFAQLIRGPAAAASLSFTMKKTAQIPQKSLTATA
jgi:hypothetical protein